MFFILLTFFTSLLLEGLGSLVSVIGISLLFGGNPIIIAIAIALDLAKIVTVSLLYTHWKSLSLLMRGYALTAALVMMTITSSGAAGYLSGEFQKAIIGTKEGDLKVNVLKEQQAKYQARKEQIDDQIAALPSKTTVNQRLRLMNGFKAEQKALDEKISAIDKELPEQQIKQISTEAKAGPIIAISKAFKISVEDAIWWVIGMIIIVFDPQAIFLVISGNFLWAKRQAAKAAKIEVEQLPIPEQPPEEAVILPVVDESAPVPEGDDFPKNPYEGQFFYRKDLDKYYAYTHGHWVLVNPPQEPEPQEPQQTKYQTYSPDAPQAPEAPPTVSMSEHTPTQPDAHTEAPVPGPTYVPTGILKPVQVSAPEDENDLDAVNFVPFTVPVAEEPIDPMVQAGPIRDDVPIHREEITRSTLGLTPADPHTIVDARGTFGHRKPTTVKR